MLYQKRPRLVPILDSYARCSFNIPWIRDDSDTDAVQLGIARIRAVAHYGPNPATLVALRAWLQANPDVTGQVPLSPLRILDILAWATVRRGNEGEPWPSTDDAS